VGARPGRELVGHGHRGEPKLTLFSSFLAEGGSLIQRGDIRSDICQIAAINVDARRFGHDRRNRSGNTALADPDRSLQPGIGERFSPFGNNRGFVGSEGSLAIISCRFGDQYGSKGAECGCADMRTIAHIAERRLGPTPLEPGGNVRIADEDAHLTLAGEQRFDDGGSDVGVGSDDDDRHGEPVSRKRCRRGSAGG